VSLGKNKKTIAIIQARMGSTRLPGKVLLPLAGKEVLFHIRERLLRVENIDNVVIATTSADADRPIVDFCHRNHIDVFIYDGNENDLLGRYISCGQHNNADIIVMVDGDCPLIHPPTIKRMVQACLKNPSAEYCKLDEHSIEGGVAVLRLTTFLKMAQLTEDPSHLEHATLFLMENPRLFSIVNVFCEEKFLNIKHRLWLDTPSDYCFLSEVYERLYKPNKIVDLNEVIDLIQKDEKLRLINAHVTQKDVREKNLPLLITTHGLNSKQMELAWGLTKILIEVYHISVRIFDENLTFQEQGEWHKFAILSGEPLQKREALLELSSSLESFNIQTAIPNGEPHVRAGLAGKVDIVNLAKLIACYVGYRDCQSSYFMAVQRSSEDDSHLEMISSCPLCESKHQKNIWTFKTGVINGICLDCGHVYLTRKHSQSAIESHYKDFGQSYTNDYLKDQSNAIFEMARSRHKFLQQHLSNKPSSLLEIGCGYGHFLSLAGENRLRVGIEPSHEEAFFARKYFGISEIWGCGYEQFSIIPPSWPKDGFDLVCSFHVLEHLEEPHLFLKFAKRVLHKNGCLYLAVPNLFTLSPDLIELSFLSQSLHLHTFSPDTLSFLLAKEGFEVIRVTEESSIPMLRSSFIVIARLASSSQLKPSKENIEKSLCVSNHFHRSLGRRIQRIEKAFDGWASLGKKVAIYGGGIHTKALLELSDISPDNIALIIDDDPIKHEKTLHGIPVYGFEQAMTQKMDVIVASSLASEHLIYERLLKIVPKNIDIIRIYEDLLGVENNYES